jgi:hypothetical protein
MSNPILTRAYAEEALKAMYGYFERARRLHEQARTIAEYVQAREFMANASAEIARWQAIREAASE